MMMKQRFFLLGAGVFAAVSLPQAMMAETTLVPGTKSEMSTFAVAPQRIVWQSTDGVLDPQTLLQSTVGQTTIKRTMPPTKLVPGKDSGSIILDFGKQLAGYLEIFTPGFNGKEPRKMRVRFGESVAEVMADIGERGAQNDHAQRDQIVELPWFGKKMVGPSGFRFVRLDAIDGEKPVLMVEVRAMLQIRDVPYQGSFRCSDERLNQIWQTGAWTVHLNMQDYLWDGVKRDRLVWLGDMHPEVAVIGAVFGHNPVVPKSLDLVKSVTPPNEWINNISSYSMWWVMIQHDWYEMHGDLEYLKQQKEYLQKLLPFLASHIDENGSEALKGPGMRFLDWPTKADAKAVHEGLQALMVMTMVKGAKMMDLLGDAETAQTCREADAKLRKHVPEPSGRKSPAALNALAGLRDAKQVAKELKAGGPRDLSTFYGYYVISALGEAGETEEVLEMIRQYWGGMLDLGATSFWEDFDLEWAKNAGRIDELVPQGKDDIHGDFGAYCYVGFRHSFCHGWAGGPTAFLSKHVLGVSPAAPGFAKVRIEAHLGELKWAEGTYPTPKGVIKLRHEKQPDGSIKSKVELPDGVVRVD